MPEKHIEIDQIGKYQSCRRLFYCINSGPDTGQVVRRFYIPRNTFSIKNICDFTNSKHFFATFLDGIQYGFRGIDRKILAPACPGILA